MTPEQVAESLGVTVNYLAEMRQDGNGPDYVKLGHRTVRYRTVDVDEWIDSNLVALMNAKTGR
jgi:excisionase family DNA binding protein